MLSSAGFMAQHRENMISRSTKPKATNLALDPSYRAHVEALEKTLNSDKALSQAVGGEFVALGTLEHLLLRKLGLRAGHTVVDVGCGSGRLACQLAPFKEISYVGSDVVPRLLEYAKTLCKRPDWQFHHAQGTSITCQDGAADFVCFFSVFTHLTHEDTYRYILEARRVLVPGGLLVMSFLEFQIPSHWRQFHASVHNLRPDSHLNQFLSRDAIEAWCQHARLEIVAVYDGDSNYIPLDSDIVCEDGRRLSGAASLGQSLAVLRKPNLDSSSKTGNASLIPEHLYLDSPNEGNIVDPTNLKVEGWLWANEGQNSIEAVQFSIDGRLVGECSQLFAREDVSRFLGVANGTPTAFQAVINDAQIQNGQSFELQVSVRYRNGRIYRSRVKRVIKALA